MDEFLGQHILLKNDRLVVMVALPNQVYKGSRFDWTGFVLQVTLDDKHTFCTQESLRPGEGTGGIGLCNEFGIERAIGYDETPIHGKFPKIGVGLLVKPDELPYSFFRDYAIEPFPILIDQADTAVTFTSLPVEHNGYAAQLIKLIKLRDHFVEINCILKNVGQKIIHTEEYNHNFVSIDHCPIGPLYCLTLPCRLQPDQLPSLLVSDRQQLTWARTPDDAFYFKTEGFDCAGSYSWQLTHPTQGAGMREYNDFPILNFALWGTTHVVSPEVFCEIKLNPGETKSWKRTYEFFKL
jgi:hypothetical protein